MSKPDGRMARFEQLIAPLEKQVYYTCLRMMGSREDAEDCAQEALLKAYRSLDSFRGQAKFSTWLYTLVTRVCLDALRRRRDEASLDALLLEGFEPADEDAEVYLHLEKGERKAMIEAALLELQVDYRAAIVLVDLQGLAYQEAAQALGIPEGTVKSRVNRARKALYHLLLRKGELFDLGERHNDERRKRS